MCWRRNARSNPRCVAFCKAVTVIIANAVTLCVGEGMYVPILGAWPFCKAVTVIIANAVTQCVGEGMHVPILGAWPLAKETTPFYKFLDSPLILLA